MLLPKNKSLGGSEIFPFWERLKSFQKRILLEKIGEINEDMHNMQ